MDTAHTCIGFGAREGICRRRALHPAPGPGVRRPYWCDDCEDARVKYISGRLERLLADFPEGR